MPSTPTSSHNSPRPHVEVRRSAQRRKTVSARREGTRIVVMIPARMSADDEAVWVERMVARIQAREAARQTPLVSSELQQRAVRLARAWLDPAVGRAVRPEEVAWVSNQRRRWGSCSPESGRIRLSHRLRTMPDWVIDYVLVHELVHLVEIHHTPRFHALVANYPDTERAKAFLDGWIHGQAVEQADRWDADEPGSDDECDLTVNPDGVSDVRRRPRVPRPREAT